MHLVQMKTVKHLFRWVWGLALGFTAAWGWGTGTGAEPEQAPAFSLPRHGGGEKVNLDDLSGSVVVLDFFAHWCVPCVRASAEMETGIRQYYASRGSNARGRPVRVLAINIEADRPEKTEAFIQRTGMKEVLDDLGGEVFKRLGGSGIPYLVIIDATGAPAGAAPARVAYRRAGFEGVARLREVIDSIGAEAPEVSARVTVPQDHTPPGKPPTQTATVPPSSTPTSKPNATETAPGAPAKKGASLETPATEMPWPQARRPATHSDLVEKATLDIAMLRASDILLTDERLEYRQTRLDSELALSLTHAHIGLHYVPESKVEHDQDVDAERGGMQASGRFRVGDRFTALAGGGGYFGYMDYRTLWLNEHFRQLDSTLPGTRRRIRGGVTFREGCAGSISWHPGFCRATWWRSTM